MKFLNLQVDSKNYSSYPKLAKTKAEAEKIAAQAALSDLEKQNDKPKIVTMDQKVITNRVINIIKNYPTGLIEKCLENDYVMEFNETLPTNWIKLVEQDVNIDVGANDIIILSLPNNLIARTVNNSAMILTEPECLKLDIKKMSDVWIHVYCAYDTTEIWSVIIDENHSVS